MIKSILAGLCGLTLALQAGAALSNNNGNGCALVQIQMLSPLDYGLLRFAKGSHGRVFMDPSGRMASQVGISVSSAAGNSPATVSISGPPNTDIYISLKENRVEDRSHTARLINLNLNHQNRELRRAGDLWVVRTPRSTGATSSLTVKMSGTLVLKNVRQRQIFSSTVDIHCEFVEGPVD